MKSPNTRAKNRRRLGLVFILAAGAMVVAGVTVLEVFLRERMLLFICYWIICLTLTLLAAGTAVIDSVRVRLESREAQRALLEQTLREVEHERQTRAKSKR